MEKHKEIITTVAPLCVRAWFFSHRNPTASSEEITKWAIVPITFGEKKHALHLYGRPPSHFPVSSSSLDHCYRESPVCKLNVAILSIHSSLFALCRNGQLCAKCSALFNLQDCSNSVVSGDRLKKNVTKAALEQRTVRDNFRCLTQWQQAAVAGLVCKGHNRLKAHMYRKMKLVASSTPLIEQQRFLILCKVGMSDLVSIFKRSLIYLYLHVFECMK